MESPLQITCRGFTHQPELDELIRKRVLELEKVAGQRLTSCHVVVDLGHEHHPGARLFQVRIDVTFAGGIVIVSRDRRDAPGHEDVQFAVRQAFEVAHREVEHASHRHG